MDGVRKAYQRAVQIPMDNVKKLWEEYQDFENGLNRITVSIGVYAQANQKLMTRQAKKFLSDLQESHMQARTVLNTLQEHLNILFPPPPPSKSARGHRYGCLDRLRLTREIGRWSGGGDST